MDITDKRYILDRTAVDPDTGCWEWTKSRYTTTGYGQLGYWPHTAHRLAYILWYGILTEKVVRHLCHNPGCCNPEHLVEGSHKDNYDDSKSTHHAANIAKRGRVAHNRHRVEIDGVEYDSMARARAVLRKSYKWLQEHATRL